ncbi:MAG TPA: DUF6636 domain-containing protein [Gaiellales bacterium]|nr:DUF6636 domain-containing protein [Gaiellales bacterium]
MSPRWPLTAAAALTAGVALGLIAGCSGSGSDGSSGAPGSGGAETVTVTNTVTVSETITATSGHSGGTQEAPTGVPTRLARYCGTKPACDDFATPSGNIRCFGTARAGGSVECDIASGLTPAPAGTGCDLDQPGIEVGGTGQARTSCRSDPTPAGLDDRIPVLAYETVWHGYGVYCLSQQSGVVCVNRDGHGYFLSRERWKTF